MMYYIYSRLSEPADIKSRYLVDEVYYVDQVKSWSYSNFTLCYIWKLFDILILTVCLMFVCLL